MQQEKPVIQYVQKAWERCNEANLLKKRSVEKYLTILITNYGRIPTSDSIKEQQLGNGTTAARDAINMG